MSGVSVHQLPQVPLLPLSSCTRTRPSVSSATAPAPMLGTLLTGCHGDCGSAIPAEPVPILGNGVRGGRGDCALASAAHKMTAANKGIRSCFIFLLKWLLVSKAGFRIHRRRPTTAALRPIQFEQLAVEQVARNLL